jgi:hypothetical protein
VTSIFIVLFMWPCQTRKYNSIWFWQWNCHNSVNSSQIGLVFFIHKSECITEVLGTSKLPNLLILKFAFLAYLSHFCMFNSSSSGRRAQTALKIFMHLLYHVPLRPLNAWYIYASSHKLAVILLQQSQLANCRTAWHGMALKLQAMAQTWWNYSSTRITW